MVTKAQTMVMGPERLLSSLNGLDEVARRLGSSVLAWTLGSYIYRLQPEAKQKDRVAPGPLPGERPDFPLSYADRRWRTLRGAPESLRWGWIFPCVLGDGGLGARVYRDDPGMREAPWL